MPVNHYVAGRTIGGASRQLNWEIMTKLSTCSAPAAMLVGTGTSGVINLQYASSFQITDNWLCSLRDISRKCDFGQDCCALCEPTRILGQLISGVADNTVRIKLLELGDALTLDQALTILRSAETSQLQAASLQQHDHAINALRRSAYKSSKTATSDDKQTRFAPDQKARGRTTATCRYCGGPRRHNTTQCPAFGKKCDNCGKDNHFASVCEGETLIVGSIHVKQVGAIINESVAISVVAHPNGPTVSIQVLPDTGSQLDAIPHSLYHTSFPNVSLRPGVAARTATGNAITCV